MACAGHRRARRGGRRGLAAAVSARRSISRPSSGTRTSSRYRARWPWPVHGGHGTAAIADGGSLAAVGTAHHDAIPCPWHRAPADRRGALRARCETPRARAGALGRARRSSPSPTCRCSSTSSRRGFGAAGGARVPGRGPGRQRHGDPRAFRDRGAPDAELAVDRAHHGWLPGWRGGERRRHRDRGLAITREWPGSVGRPLAWSRTPLVDGVPDGHRTEPGHGRSRAAQRSLPRVRGPDGVHARRARGGGAVARGGRAGGDRTPPHGRPDPGRCRPGRRGGLEPDAPAARRPSGRRLSGRGGGRRSCRWRPHRGRRGARST